VETACGEVYGAGAWFKVDMSSTNATYLTASLQMVTLQYAELVVLAGSACNQLECVNRVGTDVLAPYVTWPIKSKLQYYIVVAIPSSAGYISSAFTLTLRVSTFVCVS
jgi:hypothetical protein